MGNVSKNNLSICPSKKLCLDWTFNRLSPAKMYHHCAQVEITKSQSCCDLKHLHMQGFSFSCQMSWFDLSVVDGMLVTLSCWINAPFLFTF